jgi:hypothetical protein
MAHAVHGQQRVLDDVLGEIGRSRAPMGDGPGERRDRLQEGAVGGGVAALRGGEQPAPLLVRR